MLKGQCDYRFQANLLLSDITRTGGRKSSGITAKMQGVPKTFNMMVTMHSKVDYIVKAFQVGATGFVTKDSAPERLLQAIDAFLKGEYFIDSAVSRKVVQRLAGVKKE